jgi:branched-chain amino acid transport system permease protein
LLFTFLGGATFFFGPIIGAVLMVLAFALLSEFTQAWLLYLGLVFMFMVMYAPGGIASLIMMNLRVARFGKLRGLLVTYLGLGLTLLVALAGVGALIEMTYLLKTDSGQGDSLRYFGVTLDAHSRQSWIAAAAVFLVGGSLFTLVQRRFAEKWGAIQAHIEQEIKQRGAL